jgi:uncharacterized protein (TIGR03437 family)
MKRSIWLILFALLICASVGAQALTSITIGTSPTTPNGPVFFVDGTSYISTQTFEWPLGSAHVVQFPFSLDNNGNALPYQSALNDNIRFSFGSWAANTPIFNNQTGSIVTVVADPSLTTLIGSVTVNYLVNILFPTGVAAGSTCDPLNAPQTGMPEGVVFFNGACVGTSTSMYVPAATYTLAAVPYPGWVFYGYLIGNSAPNSLATVNVTGPMNITPQFSIAKRVDFLTSPLGLQVLIDGGIINTPPSGTAASNGTSCAPDYTRLPAIAPPGFTPLCFGQFDFLPGSHHQIGAATPQLDGIGNYWVFNAFSDGLGQNATYVADFNTSTPDVVTAMFIPGAHVSILSNPGGLKLMIDGRDNWTAYNFVWGQGQTHSITAETPQLDSHGRQWQFSSWSDGGAVAHNISVPTNTTNYSVTATYTELEQITINTTPQGLNINVDGSACSTPCVINKTAGSTSQVTIPASIPAATGSRYDFTGWSDGISTPARTVTFSQDTLTLAATYQTSFQLTAITNPSGAGTFKTVPTSPDGFYASGTSVSITAAANNGYKFVKWEGDLAGAFAGGTLLMASPHAIQADFVSVPFIPPAGIESVTGPTSDGTLAPGSLISIYGQNLAPAVLVGPGNPLSQALGNTTVTVGDYVLPLVYVSPGQISAQLPWELPDGSYTLAVHNTGLSDVDGTFTVSSASPGVFEQPNPQNLPLVLALHPDGSLVSPASPAVQGEQITIFATGLGPYTHPAVDGFPASPVTNFLVADAITVTLGAVQITPDWAGAATGIVGVSVVKVTIAPDMPAATNANFTITVSGKPSLPMLLPMQ